MEKMEEDGANVNLCMYYNRSVTTIVIFRSNRYTSTLIIYGTNITIIFDFIAFFVGNVFFLPYPVVASIFS